MREQTKQTNKLTNKQTNSPTNIQRNQNKMQDPGEGLQLTVGALGIVGDEQVLDRLHDLGGLGAHGAVGQLAQLAENAAPDLRLRAAAPNIGRH